MRFLLNAAAMCLDRWPPLRATGKVHGSLARAGKVRGQTPKVPKQEKKKQPKGRAMKRIKYNRRFVNVGASPGLVGLKAGGRAESAACGHWQWQMVTGGTSAVQAAWHVARSTTAAAWDAEINIKKTATLY